MTATDHAGPHERAAIAFLRRGPTGVRLLIGGRYLGVAGSPPAVLSIALDGVPAAELKVTPNPIWFAHWIELPAGAGAGTGPYGPLTATVKSLDPGRRAPMIGLEQFDAGTSDDVMFAFVDGWQEPEGDPKTGRLWRWTSDRSALEIRGPNADLVLTLSGESPLKSFDHAPEVVVKAGDRALGRFRPSADFSEQIDLPASAFSASAGRLTIETNLTFVPAERGSSPDRRRLGLRVYQVAIRRK